MEKMGRLKKITALLVIFVTAACGQKMSTLGGSRGLGSSSHSVNIAWNASTSSVVEYNIYRGVNSGGPYSKLNSVPQNILSYLDSSVQGGQTYYYVTTSVDSLNSESQNSNEISATVPSP